MWPPPKDPLYVAQPDQYRSELYDRLASPFYPIAFIILTYMFLGPPQTTRQSRALALVALGGAVLALRMTGFFSVVVGVHVPYMLAVQFIALSAAIAIGLWQISRGRAIENSVALIKATNAISDRIARATAG
jgi:lipopolysaccharide export system permease protein